MDESLDRNQFLNLAGIFQGGLVAVAAVLAWMTGIDPREYAAWDWRAVAWGIGGTAPLFVLFLVSMRYPLGPLSRMKQFLVDTVAPLLAQCRWYDLILLGLLAGFTEELLFRGVLQPWFESLWGRAAGLIAASVLFGLAHCVTRTYALIAGLVGAYLGWLLDASGERNLLAPVLTHSVYDYLAFLALVRLHRRGPSV
ncbi:MAG: type II CAAX endopeptidase family protein [Planctomycetales bacterium]